MQWLCAIPLVFLSIDCVFKDDICVSEQNLFLSNQHKLFMGGFTTIHSMKSAWPAEPTLLISTLLMGAMRATPASRPITKSRPTKKF